jgi:hypothetical protein
MRLVRGLNKTNILLNKEAGIMVYTINLNLVLDDEDLLSDKEIEIVLRNLLQKTSAQISNVKVLDIND